MSQVLQKDWGKGWHFLESYAWKLWNYILFLSIAFQAASNSLLPGGRRESWKSTFSGKIIKLNLFYFPLSRLIDLLGNVCRMSGKKGERKALIL